MICKDCLHYEACKGIYMKVSEYKSIADFDDKHYADIHHCPDFTDKSEWIHSLVKTAYYVIGYGNNVRVIEEPIYGLTIENGKQYVIDEYRDFYKIGEEVFLVKEDAEKAIERRKNQ